jgi:hypothetical protein
MITRTLVVLAEASLQFGLIGIDEYIERCEVAWWLGEEGAAIRDPRLPLNVSESHEHPRLTNPTSRPIQV